MPIYEYQVKKGYEGCKYCKSSFTIEQKITDDPLEKCPKCDSPLVKIISKTNFHLKDGGVGWEKNGYSGSSKKKPKA